MAPPKRAPRPTAAVARGAPPVEEVDPTPDPAPGAPELVGAAVIVVAAVTPDVNGTPPSLAVEAPGNAGTVVDGFGAAVEFCGLRTPSMTWTTPLETKTSGVMTFALLTKTSPSMTVTVMFPPPTVSTDVLPVIREL
jgi:hypothetical protein